MKHQRTSHSTGGFTRDVAGAAVLALGFACTLGGCYTRLASLHPATDITRTEADGDRVYLDDAVDPRDVADRDPRAYGNYLEDRYLDPYTAGLTYSDRYGSNAGGYGDYRDYYERPWWRDPRYGGGHSGGGSFGSSGSGTPPVDTTKVRVVDGRRLWTTPDLPPPGASQGGGGVTHDGPPAVGGSSGTPPAGGTPADTSKATPKKGTGRRLWR